MITSLLSTIIGTGFVAAILWLIIFVAPAFVPKLQDGANKRFKVWEKHPIKLGAIFFLITLAINLTLFIPYVYSDGTKRGTLTKITKKGFIFKTYEGQLNLGGMVSNGEGGSVPNVFNFSVTDKAIFDSLVEKEQATVSLKYNQYLRVPLTKGDTNYIIQSIK